MEDFFADLLQFSPATIESACAEYRRDPANRFFPHPGAILVIAKKIGGDPAMLRAMAENDRFSKQKQQEDQQ